MRRGGSSRSSPDSSRLPEPRLLPRPLKPEVSRVQNFTWRKECN
eukprot:COSAG06_NODE_1416_length_9534_cov_8.199788_9_plen_44_part_00